jgi:transcriptional regulator with XRE-family HTH domain
MIKANKLVIKKEIGKRFRKFREAIGKTQAQVARELSVYQSTITNIEIGRTFPGVKYIHYFHKKYGLNNNWLLNNIGDMFNPEEDANPRALSKIACYIPKGDPRYPKYADLIEMMQIPVIEQVLLAKLAELKVIAQYEIEEFRTLEKERKKMES